jgi:plastocyanin
VVPADFFWLHPKEAHMQRIRRTPVLLIGVLLPVAVAAGCGGADTNGSGSEAARPTEPAAAGEQQVAIDNFAFSPATLTVPAGTKVTWVNRDDVPHTATSTSKPRAFDSGTLDTDDKFSFEFKTPGTYEYFCAVHPKMTAKIIVK